jgi:hypothetical protein
MAVVNTYSSINALLIPLDMSVSKFSKKMRKEIATYFLEDRSGTGGVLSYLFDPIRDVMIHLHNTCKLRPDKWNYEMKRQGHIHSDVFQENIRTHIGAIEGILEACYEELQT